MAHVFMYRLLCSNFFLYLLLLTAFSFERHDALTNLEFPVVTTWDGILALLEQRYTGKSGKSLCLSLTALSPPSNYLTFALSVVVDTIGLDTMDIASLLIPYNNLVLPSSEYETLTTLASEVIKSEDGSGEVLLIFDDSSNLSSYSVIPRIYWANLAPRPLRLWLEERYSNPSIEFSSSIYPLELRWVHAKGNFQLVPLGVNGTSVILYPSSMRSGANTLLQYSRPGHLFVGLRPSYTNEKFDIFPLHRVCALYLVPATLRLSTSPSSVDLSGMIQVSGGVHTCHENCEREVLNYLRRQRSTQIWLQHLALKNVMFHLPSPAINSLTTSRSSYRIFSLPSEIYSIMSNEYLSRRYTVEDGSGMEPLVSTVFNQLDVATYHVPLSPSTLEAVGKVNNN